MQEIHIDNVEILIEDLDQSALVDWGLWGEEPVEETVTLRIRAAEFESTEEGGYLEDNAPVETPALLLQRALARFLGR